MTAKNTGLGNRQAWEQTEFPVLCETCLGENPYVRMTKTNYGDACKICDRPYTVFRWCPGHKMRFKRTEVCQTCAKLKNVCQTCLLDLEYGLPVQVRDKYLQMDQKAPTSDVNREYWIQNQEKMLANSNGLQTLEGYSAPQKSGRAMLEMLARRKPNFKRNLPHICSFWVKGDCKRGDLCPYRHEMPSDPNDPLSNQNMKDRYYGNSDPVAEKMLGHAKTMSLEPPEDQNIKSLYIGGLQPEFDITEHDIRGSFYEFGEISRVTMLAEKSACAFVEFATRDAAERAAQSLYNRLSIKDHLLRVLWAKPKRPKTQDPSSSSLPNLTGMPGFVPVPGAKMPSLQPPPQQGAKPAYPSMDPMRVGTKMMDPMQQYEKMAAEFGDPELVSKHKPSSGKRNAGTSGETASKKKPQGLVTSYDSDSDDGDE
eukprot:m.79758 g.79758  ORF g.79758 m.79758 type:complete len:425 (-) comp8615_c2_seq1:254-1528(-)